MIKQKYINNKELLKEIHKSKITYCWFAQPEHAHFDAIVTNIDGINDELIEKVITKKKVLREKTLFLWRMSRRKI